MKAAIRQKYCLPDRINVPEIETPSPKDDEVLIRVAATTVNRTDCANLTAKPFIMRFVLGLVKPRKIILGTDFAGEVVEMGKNVNSFSPGNRVFGFCDTGIQSQAEYVAVSADKLFFIPENIDYQQAVAALEGGHYAYSFVHKVKIHPGRSVLVNGATGAIGSALLQFLQQQDLRIVATANTKNIERIRSLGADKIIDYTTEDFAATDEKFDFVFDAVGKSTYGKCKPLLKPEGVYISSELGPYAQNILFAATTAFSKRKKVIFPVPYNARETIPYIIQSLESGAYLPLIDREYELENISEAYTYVMSGKKTGNVILKIQN